MRFPHDNLVGPVCPLLLAIFHLMAVSPSSLVYSTSLGGLGGGRKEGGCAAPIEYQISLVIFGASPPTHSHTLTLLFSVTQENSQN